MQPFSSSTSASSKSSSETAPVHLGMREHAELLALGQQSLDLFEFLQFGYGHRYLVLSSLR